MGSKDIDWMFSPVTESVAGKKIGDWGAVKGGDARNKQ